MAAVGLWIMDIASHLQDAVCELQRLPDGISGTLSPMAHGRLPVCRRSTPSADRRVMVAHAARDGANELRSAAEEAGHLSHEASQCASSMSVCQLVRLLCMRMEMSMRWHEERNHNG